MRLKTVTLDSAKHQEIGLFEENVKVPMCEGYIDRAAAQQKAEKVFFIHEDDFGWSEDEKNVMDLAQEWAEENNHTLI